jgi:ethanolamine ammonia-lyase small subunit|eukprot:COSAG06_NODE_311_length_17771_cov_31.730647_9_plen_98_part_00
MPTVATQTDLAEDTIQRLQQEHEKAHDAVCKKLVEVEQKLKDVLSIPANIMMQELLESDGDDRYLGWPKLCKRIADELVVAAGARKRPRVAAGSDSD